MCVFFRPSRVGVALVEHLQDLQCSYVVAVNVLDVLVYTVAMVVVNTHHVRPFRRQALLGVKRPGRMCAFIPLILARGT